MVFFTCSHCGESVKKPSVSKHYQTKCRNKDPFLTCVDCLKDFKGTEYEAHTKCMTEDEKYSAKGYVPKPSQNKGEKKQQAWQECIQTVLKKPTLKQDEKDLIKAISKYENVPRKKSKFMNFLSNAFKQFANKNDLIDRVWTEMESVFKEMSAKSNEELQQQKEQKQVQQKTQNPQKQESQKASKKPTTAEGDAVKKEKKRKRQAEESKTSEASESAKADEKLKKKKAKHSEGNTEVLLTNETGDQQEKKNRKRKADENGQTEQNDSVADEAEPGKKKKKKKNDKLADTQISEAAAPSSELESKSKKKNKKPKSADIEAKPSEGETTPVGTGDANPVKKEKKGKKSENKENRREKATEESNAKGAGEMEKPASKKKKAAKAEVGGNEEKPEAFDWKATILQVINQDAKNNRILLQKLQKKVLKLHCQILNCENSEKKEKKFMKKLKEMSQIEIDKDFVVLKS